MLLEKGRAGVSRPGRIAEGLVFGGRVEVFAKLRNAGAREDAEDTALVVGKFWTRLVWEICNSTQMIRTRRRRPAEFGEFFSEEGSNSRQTQMSQARAVVEQFDDALFLRWLAWEVPREQDN